MVITSALPDIIWFYISIMFLIEFVELIYSSICSGSGAYSGLSLLITKVIFSGAFFK